MTTRPKLRQLVRRMKDARLCYFDEKRNRFVVYRRAGGVERKTSVRVLEGNLRSAEIFAGILARRLHNWPAHKLAEFKW